MEERPRNLKAMLSEAKDTSELMVDLGYASLFFADTRMADEVTELEERLTELVHEMREVCVLAARSKHDAEQMSSVLHVLSAIERMGTAAVDVARIVTHKLGIPAGLVADLAAADQAYSDLAHVTPPGNAADRFGERRGVSATCEPAATSRTSRLRRDARRGNRALRCTSRKPLARKQADPGHTKS